MTLRPIPRPASPLLAPAGAREAFAASALAALLRGWWMILLGGVVGAVAVYAAVSTLPRLWTAEALLALDTQRVAIPELQGVLGGEGPGDPMPLVRSEVQALRARGLLREAAEASGIARLPSVAATAERVGLPDAVGERLSVFNDNRSLVISLAFTATDPAAAAGFVNALLDRYLAGRAAARAATNRTGYDALSARERELRTEVEALESRLSAARAGEDLVTTRAGSVQQQQLEDLSAALARATAERAEAVAAWERARGARSVTELSDVVASQTVARLRDQEAEASRRAAEAASRLGPNHPDRRAAVAQLAAAQGQTGSEVARVVGSLRVRAEAATARETALTERLARASTEAAGIAARQSDLRRLEREVEGRRTLLQTITSRLEQTGVEASATPPSGVRVLSRAEAPVQPSGPKRGLASAFGLLAGAAVGALLALFLGLRRRRSRDPAGIADPRAGEDAALTPWTPAPTDVPPGRGATRADPPLRHEEPTPLPVRPVPVPPPHRATPDAAPAVATAETLLPMRSRVAPPGPPPPLRSGLVRFGAAG